MFKYNVILHTLIDICITTGVNPFGAISDGCAFSDAHKTAEHKQRQKDKLKESEIFWFVWAVQPAFWFYRQQRIILCSCIAIQEGQRLKHCNVKSRCSRFNLTEWVRLKWWKRQNVFITSRPILEASVGLCIRVITKNYSDFYVITAYARFLREFSAQKPFGVNRLVTCSTGLFSAAEWFSAWKLRHHRLI